MKVNVLQMYAVSSADGFTTLQYNGNHISNGLYKWTKEKNKNYYITVR